MSQIKVNSIVPAGGLSAWADCGGIIQVKQTTWTTLWSHTGYTGADISGASLTITPTSSNSKILIQYGVWISSNYYKTYIDLLRGTTRLLQGAAAGSRNLQTSTFVSNVTQANTHGFMHHHVITYIDSPATTSATTYKLQGWGRGTTSYTRVNYTVPDRDTTEYDSRHASTLLAMEISA